MARIKPSPETRLLALIRQRGPIGHNELANRARMYPVARLDAALRPLVADGRVTKGHRKPKRGPSAVVYSLAGNTETLP